VNDKQKIGSETAKGGFKNELSLKTKFDNFKLDVDAQKWLKIMGYDWEKIQHLSAEVIPPRISSHAAKILGAITDNLDESIVFKKADLQLSISIMVGGITFIENISAKKANRSSNFNQVDKRSVDRYQQLWGFPESVAETLRLFTGAVKPKFSSTRDKRRLFFDELDAQSVAAVVQFFSANKTLIVTDLLRGRGALSATWFIVTKTDGKSCDWFLQDINTVCNFYAMGDVEITKRGSLKIGKITMQRKGGTPDPESLQFKIKPLDLFNSALNR
jgi:hypothetical protein